jgi:hypothetical protein
MGVRGKVLKCLPPRAYPQTAIFRVSARLICDQAFSFESAHKDLSAGHWDSRRVDVKFVQSAVRIVPGAVGIVRPCRMRDSAVER